ncbi:MAG TPA: DNA polymerase I, partial [Hyphomicrobium sp.]|nr:DNA polymerase I [Hyphomicrobium sp.]
EPQTDALLGFLRTMEFNTLTKRIADALGAEAPPPLAVSVGASLKAKPKDLSEKIEALEEEAASEDSTPAAAVAAGAAVARGEPVDRSRYRTVTTHGELENWIAKAQNAGLVAFDTETSRLSATEADLVGFSLAIVPGEACYVPVGHQSGGGDLFGGDDNRPPQLAVAEAVALMKPLLEDPSVLKIGQNIKYDVLVMKRYGVELAPFDDTLLLSYALDGGRGQHGMDVLSERHLGHTCLSFSEVIEHAPGA